MRVKQVLLIGFFVFSILNCSMLFATNTIKVNPAIDKVTLFLGEAEINRSIKKLMIEKGQTYLVITEISNKLDTKSLSAVVIGGATILSTRVEENKEDLPDVAAAKRMRQVLVDMIKKYKSGQDSFKKEKTILEENSHLLSKTDEDNSFDKIRHAATVYRHRMEEIEDTIYKLEKHIKDLGKRFEKEKEKLKTLNAKAPINQIVILVQAEEETNIKLYVEYKVKDTYWTPLYHLKAKDTKTPITLEYKALIKNNTGVDWNNIKLKLEVSNALKKRPKLLTETLIDQHEVEKQQQKLAKKQKKKAKSKKTNNKNKQTNKLPDNQESNNDLLTLASGFDDQQPMLQESNNDVANNGFNEEFEISQTYSIAADGEDYIIDIESHEIPVEYIHFCIPKLDETVFLLARISDWQGIRMLAGNATVYYKKNIVGRSLIDKNALKNGIDLMLNTIKGVTVTRVESKEILPSKFLNKKITENINYTIQVTNNQPDTIQVELFDQLPIVKSKTIKVESIIAETATDNDKESGKIKWNYQLAPKESKAFDCSYILKYSKKSQLAGRKETPPEESQSDLLIPSELAIDGMVE